MKKIAKKRTTPEHRAERRLNQAMRREASYEVGARAGKASAKYLRSYLGGARP